jgi:hypothetical protein
MKERQVWNWTFLRFETSQKNRLVQSWFDGLSEDVRDEVRDIFTYLQVAAITEWKRPRFSLLDDGVSEIRFSCNSITYRNIRMLLARKSEAVVYTLARNRKKGEE